MLQKLMPEVFSVSNPTSTWAHRYPCSLIAEKMLGMHSAGRSSRTRRTTRTTRTLVCPPFSVQTQIEVHSKAGKKGKEVLPDFVQDAKLKVEYAALTEAEKGTLVAELEQVKAMKAKGFQSSARSRVNDITKTMAVLENEVNPSYISYSTY